ncbi:hypothetical protein HOA59_03145 [archaeon]|jgi:hypothetical protein|nr:hypothetical protein [archaeon]MBT6824405.1 hypothetical protein [archaeon]MBT7107316.1 hypothetical protein [archaeon]MBT7297381.1 hypothetical protein [archaeon]
MVNKKAYMKTLEAVIALVIFLMAITFTITVHESDQPAVPQDIELLQDTILNKIEYNETLRAQAFAEDTVQMDFFINNTVQTNIAYNFTLCTDTAVCTIPTSTSEIVYSDSLIMVNNNSDVVLVRLILWKK